MAINKRLPQQPRLPQVGATDYDQQLNRALHEYFRIIASWQNAAAANVFNAADYGSVKAAYTAAAAAFPGGDFVVHVSGDIAHGGSFTWALRGALTGDATSSSRVNCTSGDTITITSQWFSCHDIEFKFATQATAGTVLKNVGGFYSDIHDVTITSPNIGFEYSGSAPYYSGRHVRSNIIMTNVRLHGDTFNGTHDVLTTNLYCIGSELDYPSYAAGSAGIKTTGWVEGCQFTNCTYLLFERTHNISGSNHCTFVNCYFDSGKYAALLEDSNNLTIDNCWYSNGRGQAGVSGQGLVVIDSNNVTVSGSRMVNCGSSGFGADNCDNLSLIGNVIANNSWDSANAYYGATINNCNNIAVLGNQMSNTVIPGGASQINSLIFSGTNTGTALGNPSISLINTTGINTGGGGGDVLAAGNNNFTGANVFNGTSKFTSGMIDLNNVQGISGQIWKSSGIGVAPQWTSIAALLKSCNGVGINGDGGDFVVYRGGTGAIANGSYEATVTFSSMGFTPTLEHISITLGGAADHYTQVRNITSTSFVVGTNQNAGAKTFGWRILKFNP